MKTDPDWKVLIPELIVIHCTATPADMFVDAKMVDGWHKERGFYDIGYHWLIQRDGTIEEGRPMTRMGAHAAGHNHNSVGIALAGGMTADMKRPENNFTDAQFDNLYGLCSSLIHNYPTIIDMCGHCQLPGVTKACPSFDVEAWENSHVSLGQCLDANYARR